MFRKITIAMKVYCLAFLGAAIAIVLTTQAILALNSVVVENSSRLLKKTYLCPVL